MDSLKNINLGKIIKIKMPYNIINIGKCVFLTLIIGEIQFRFVLEIFGAVILILW